MIDYYNIAIFILFNFIIYFSVSIILDLKLLLPSHISNENSKQEKPPAWNNKISMITTTIPSMYLWLLFILFPISAFLNEKILYDFVILSNLEPINDFLQFIGIVLIFAASFIAIVGRINRGSNAISWGIPNKLTIHGIFKYIRHPLYSSYCFYFIGFNLTYQSIILLPLLIGIYGYYKTSIYEEKILLEHFGENYKEYIKKTGKFIPKIIK